MHLAQSLTVHLRTCNDNAARHEVLNLIFLAIPFGLYLRTDEGLDGFGVSLGAYNEQFVAHLEGSLAVRNAHLAIVEQS